MAEIFTSFCFRAAAETGCFRRKAGMSPALFFAAVLSFSTASRVANASSPIETHMPPLVLKPYHLHAIDIYEEQPRSRWQDHRQIEHFQRYVHDKRVLTEALASCRKDRTNCSRPLRDLMQFLDAVSKITEKLTQIELVNAWVNVSITYDAVEQMTTKTNADHRTLVQTIVEKKGICDEIARVKLFIVEALNFDQRDVRWIAESTFKDGMAQPQGHAVVAVFVDGKIWMMNNQAIAVTADDKNLWTVQQAIVAAGGLESDGRQLNFLGRSQFADENYSFIPVFGFNASHIYSFAPSYPLNYQQDNGLALEFAPLPAAASVGQGTEISAATIERVGAVTIMQRAISERYRIEPSPNTELRRPKQKIQHVQNAR